MAEPEQAKCPICGKPLDPGKPGAARFRPFCSPRCADVDLGRWFTEGYAMPSTAPPEPPDDDAG